MLCIFDWVEGGVIEPSRSTTVVCKGEDVREFCVVVIQSEGYSYCYDGRDEFQEVDACSLL